MSDDVLPLPKIIAQLKRQIAASSLGRDCYIRIKDTALLLSSLDAVKTQLETKQRLQGFSANLIESWRVRDVEKVSALVEDIRPRLAGQTPGVQSGVLAQILATWLSAFPEDTRDQLLADHMALVEGLIAKEPSNP
jgi:hypothetical protein